MPPDFEELPLPNTKIGISEDQNQEIKNLIKEKENGDNETVNKNQNNKNLEEFLLDKIKKN